jgi:hypothetical protein
VIIANSEKAAEAQNGVRNFAALLVDHYAFDRSNLAVVGSVNCRAFYLVAANRVDLRSDSAPSLSTATITRRYQMPSQILGQRAQRHPPNGQLLIKMSRLARNLA